MSNAVLSIRDLTVKAQLDGETRTLIDAVSFDLGKGEILGLVGESGSGKSMICRALVKLLPSKTIAITGGSILLSGRDLVTLDEMRPCAPCAGPTSAWCSRTPPAISIPSCASATRSPRVSAIIRANRVARRSRLQPTFSVRSAFPIRPGNTTTIRTNFSGGMRQRAMIAVALSCNPEILIADEPTTALDVTIQAQILKLLMDLRDSRGLSIILITHDLGIVAQTCDRIAVLRHGQLLELGDKRRVLSAPQHAYTISLLKSHPSMPEEGGLVPAQAAIAANRRCKPLLEIDDLVVRFPTPGLGLFKGRPKYIECRPASACVSCRANPSASSVKAVPARAHWRAPFSG
jgi:peptide/nickel transport system ATP-binding protein